MADDQLVEKCFVCGTSLTEEEAEDAFTYYYGYPPERDMKALNLTPSPESKRSIRLDCFDDNQDELRDDWWAVSTFTDDAFKHADGFVKALHEDGEWYQASIEAAQSETSKLVKWMEGPVDDQVCEKAKQEIKLCYRFVGWEGVQLADYPYKSIQHYLEKKMDASFNIFDDVAIDDSAVSRLLRKELELMMNAMAQHEYKDFHPGSENKVLDIVHPSMFCYVKGKSWLWSKDCTQLIQEEPLPPYNPRRRWHADHMTQSNYQWLPAEAHVDTTGKATFTSYINGLGERVYHPRLYACLEEMLTTFIPMFEDVLSRNKQDSVTLRDRDIQVICKLAEYRLEPGQSHEGVWHLEGMKQEAIIATGINYLQTTPAMQDDGLAFRRGLTEDEEEEVICEYTHDYPPPFELQATLPLGTVETTAGRSLVFPNTHQHKLLGLHNPATNATTATRKIAVFFLVDPERPILSTARVPDQNLLRQHCMVAYIVKMYMEQHYSRISEVVIDLILKHLSYGFTLDQAQTHRQGLMHDRRVYKNELNEDVEREVELCEH